MDKFLTHICRISDHPLRHQSDSLRLKYVMGLGSVLHSVSNGHENMRMLFEQWGYSILEQDVSQWFQSDDISCIDEALSLNRAGFRFFRAKHQFYFDCYYLTETFDKTLLGKLEEFLNSSGCNIFTKSALKRTKKFFVDNEGTLKVEVPLLKHRDDNRSFAQRYENRILVVATVSAGKSTLINALIGHSYGKVKTGVCTTNICKIHNKPVSDGITLSSDNILFYDPDCDSHTSEDSVNVGMHFESSLGRERICLLDTPGVNNSRDISHILITSNAIKSNNYDVVIFVSNGQYNGTNDERQLLALLQKNIDKPILFVLNQLDKFKNGEDDINKMINEYRNELVSIGFKKPQIFPLSAQFAYLLKIENSLEEEEAEDLELMRKRFKKNFLDLQNYIERPSMNDLERSGLIELELQISKLLK